MTLLFQLAGAAPRYAQLLRSQYWSPQKLGAYSRAQLGQTLNAAAAIPFYGARWGETPRPDDFDRLPILKRTGIGELNESARSLRSGKRFYTGRSSGSTGIPREFLFDAGHQRGRFASRARYLRAHGWGPFQRTAWTIVAPEDIPDHEFLHSRLFPRNEFLQRFREFTDLVVWLRKLDPLYVGVVPSVLEGLLPIFERQGERIPSLRLIFSGSEVLEDTLRERTRQILGVDVAEYYGSTEAFLAWQCPRGALHVNAEHVLLEVVDDANRPVAPGELGRVLVTTLENHLMPLVRYEIGDYAQAASGPCPCGRTLPLIGRVAGRGINLFRMAGGRLISPWRIIFTLTERPELGQFQIVQKDIDRYLIRYVADRSLDADLVTSIRDEIRRLLHSAVAVGFERVAEIRRTRTGKFMAAISELSAQATDLPSA